MCWVKTLTCALGQVLTGSEVCGPRCGRPLPLSAEVLHVCECAHRRTLGGGTTCLAAADYHISQAFQGDIADVVILDHLVSLDEVRWGTGPANLGWRHASLCEYDMRVQVVAASASPIAGLDGVSYAWRTRRSEDGGMVDDGPHATHLRVAGGIEHVARVECSASMLPGTW